MKLTRKAQARRRFREREPARTLSRSHPPSLRLARAQKAVASIRCPSALCRCCVFFVKEGGSEVGIHPTRITAPSFLVSSILRNSSGGLDLCAWTVAAHSHAESEVLVEASNWKHEGILATRQVLRFHISACVQHVCSTCAKGLPTSFSGMLPHAPSVSMRTLAVPVHSYLARRNTRKATQRSTAR